MLSNSIKTGGNIVDFKFKNARIPLMYDNIRVVVGSEENIFEETYVTCVLQNERIVKFKKSALAFGND